MRCRIDGCRVKDRDPVPATLDLDGKMTLEAIRGLRVVEDALERRVLQRGPIDVTGNPVVVEDRRTL